MKKGTSRRRREVENWMCNGTVCIWVHKSSQLKKMCWCVCEYVEFPGWLTTHPDGGTEYFGGPQNCSSHNGSCVGLCVCSYPTVLLQNQLKSPDDPFLFHVISSIVESVKVGYTHDLVWYGISIGKRGFHFQHFCTSFYFSLFIFCWICTIQKPPTTSSYYLRN